jgi:adenine-specific DNA-methyltransferase
MEKGNQKILLKTEIDNVWYGTIISTFSKEKKYVVQTSTETVKRALIMTTDPGDLVLDITCGSGVTAFVCEEFGRRWITCDTSRVSITLAKQRLMTALFPFYELAYQSEGISSGFKYKTVPHISLKMIARQENAINEYLFDDPLIVKNKQRITGPFTVEAVPAPYAKSFDELDNDNIGSDTSMLEQAKLFVKVNGVMNY